MLIKQNTPDQVAAVLTHEIGHWKMNHTFALMLSNQVFGVFHLYLFSYFYHNESILRSFRFFKGNPVFIPYYLFTYVEASVTSATQFLRNLRTRKHEYSADSFASDQGYAEGVAKSLITMSTENLNFPNSDWIYSAYHHTHPKLADRLNAIGYVSKEKVGNLKLEVEGKE